MSPVLVIALVAMLCGNAAGTWLDTTLTYRKKITINHLNLFTGSPSVTAANCDAFPVLLTITSADLTTARSDGGDFRVTASDYVTRLPLEVESFDKGTGTLIAWTKVDIKSATDVVIYLYWGNTSYTQPAANDTYGSQNVWDSGYKLVCHVKETSGTQYDSTANGNNSSTISGLIQGSATGKLDGANSYDGVNDYEDFPLPYTFTSITTEMWLNYTGQVVANTTQLTARYDGVNDDMFYYYIKTSDACLRWNSRYNSIAAAISNKSNAFTPGTWYHVSGRRQASLLKMWVNGGTHTNKSDATDDGTPITTTRLRIGGDASPFYYHLFADHFDRTDSGTLGRNWTETEDASNYAEVGGNRCKFTANDAANSPYITHTFSARSTGKFKCRWKMKFQRTGTDSNYEVRFQLGDSTLNPATSDTTGAAINLRWGDKTKSGLSDEENLSYVTGAGTTFTQLGVVSGSGGDATVEVTVNMDASPKTYDISVTGPGLISGTGSAAGVAFDNALTSIDRLVVTLDQVAGADFSYKEIDDVDLDVEGYPWYGLVDEIRVSNVFRSDAWMRATYVNQSSPSTFMTWGTLEQPTLAITLKDAADTTDYTTWAIGTGKALNTANVMTTSNCVLVKNTGDLPMDVGMSAAGTNWTLGSSAGADQCVLMGRFNGDSAPAPESFDAAYDVVTASLAWATSSGGSGLYEGASNGNNITANNGRKLYMYLKTPSSLSAIGKANETITVTISCRAAP